MPNNASTGDREEPIGEPVVRGDPSITGPHAKDAIRFDPSDPESLELAVYVVRDFASDPQGPPDHLSMLRGAAACAALVRGTGSYKAASARAGDAVTVSFLRKWARVHDLPIEIRRYIAQGDIPPSAAKELARLRGPNRFVIAWTLLDHDITVDEVRRIVTRINNGESIETALETMNITPGSLTITLPVPVYREFRRLVGKHNTTPDHIITQVLENWIATQEPTDGSPPD
jgi:hypothetical protein